MDISARRSTIPLTRAHWRIAAAITLAGLIVAFPSMTIPPAAGWPLAWWLYWPVWLTAAMGLLALIIWRYISERRAAWLLVATVALVTVLGMVFNATAQEIVNQSDRNAALNVAVTELAHGRYPYYAHTQLGNPISPLPGALLLAALFVLGLGSSAYQNYFWLLVLAALLANLLRSTRLALFVLWALLLSPMVLQEFLYQSDLMANSIYLLAAVVLFLRYPRRLWAGVFLGIALASRINAVFYLPLVAMYLWRRDGLRLAVRACAVPALTAALLILPFYLYDPAGFSPLHALSKVAIPGLPWAALAIEGLTVAAVGLLALRARTEAQFWQGAALAQVVPVMLAVAAGLAASEPLVSLNERFSFGQNFVLVGLVALVFTAARTLPE